MTSETKYNLSPNPVLYFSDENGNPLASGKLWFFKASAHATEKAVYKDRQGTTAWIQPIVLDAGGHAIDPTSSSIKPVYFASDENYYLVWEKADTSSYYTEDDFNAPANLIIQSQITTTANIRNYILNSQFRFFNTQELKSTDDDIPANTDITIAPEGWTFRRNNEQGEMVISFETFAEGQSDVLNTPTNYLNFNKTGFGTGGETENDFTYAIGNTQDFSDKTLTLGLTGLSTSSSTISVYIRQFFGTGGTPSATVTTPIDVISLDGTWDEKTLQIQIPTVSGKSFGTNSDDVLSLILRAPLNSIAQFSLTNFQFNIGTSLQIYDKKTEFYDGIEAKAYGLPVPTPQDKFSTLRWDGSEYIFDPETGKVSNYLLGDVPDGYVPLDGTTYVREDKISGSQIEYDRLYQKWDSDSHLSNGNAFGYGEDGFYPSTYPTAGGTNLVFVNEKKDTSITPWTAETSGFTFNISRSGGDKGFVGEIFSESYLKAPIHQRTPGNNLIVENVDVGAVTAPSVGTIGSGFTPAILDFGSFVVGSGSTKNVIFLDTLADWSGIQGGEYFLISSTVSDYYVWFVLDNVGVDPAVAARIGIKISIYSTESITSILDKIKNALNSTGEFASNRLFGLQVERKSVGVVTATTKETSNIIVENETLGSVSTNAFTDLLFPKAEFLTEGQYFFISSPTTDYYVWFKKDGLGVDPAIGGRTGILINFNSDDDYITVIWKVLHALEGTAETEITNIPDASSISAGDYFFSYNDSTEFYVWYEIDDAGTDPDISGKTGIKVSILSTDLAVSVVQKTSKAISSYYFIVPNYEGYFLRSMDNGSGIDSSAEVRLPRGDGTSGDVIGSIQLDTNKSHVHSILTELNTAGQGGGDTTVYESRANFVPGRISAEGFEARPRNRNVLYCIKI